MAMPTSLAPGVTGRDGLRPWSGAEFAVSPPERGAAPRPRGLCPSGLGVVGLAVPTRNDTSALRGPARVRIFAPASPGTGSGVGHVSLGIVVFVEKREGQREREKDVS